LIFAGLELARRLERQEAVAGASFVEARRRLNPESGATWLEACGVHALFDGADSPITQTFGLGIFEAATPELLDALEAFFAERGAPVSHELSPLAGIEASQLLASRGYQPVELTSVMYQPLPASSRSAGSPNPKIEVRRIVAGEEDLWGLSSARGWTDNPEFTEFLRGFGRVMAASTGLYAFLAFLEGEPAGTAVLRCHEGVALFAGASTIPQFRQQGVQRALLAARMDLALNLDCDLAMMCAAPGSASQRNAERQGFRIAYTRTKWQRPKLQ
jgi:GNAT superfamily N-acetyltransferase